MVIGVSSDKLEDQQKFTEKESLNFPLYADPDQKAARAFGVGPDGYPKRVTFVIDKKGTVRKVYPAVRPAAHADEVLKYVKEHLADKE